MRLLRRLLAVGPSGWFDLGEAQIWLIWAQIRVLVVPKGRLAPVGSRSAPDDPRPPSDSVNRNAHRIALAVKRAARFGPVRAECLVRSIALQRMLRSRGIPHATICFGVRQHGGEFQSHAWIELGGTVIGDSPRHVSSFARLDRIGA